MRNFTACIMMILVVITACNDFDNEPLGNQVEQMEQNSLGEMLVLGKKNEIPFTVENMRKAYDRLKGNPSISKLEFHNVAGEEQPWEATHYYYRFLPKDTLELVQLQNDTVLHVSDVPFEHDIEVEGHYYKDPSISSEFTYYYSVFDVGYDFPTSIEHEKVADLYFPPDVDEESDDDTAGKPDRGTLTQEKFGVMLETEARRMLSALDEEELSELMYLLPDRSGSVSHIEAISRGFNPIDLRIDFTKAIASDVLHYTPRGRITFEDDVLTRMGGGNNILGLPGASVKIRKYGFLVIRTAQTDKNGYYKARSTKSRRVKYSVHFSNRDFQLRNETPIWIARDRDSKNYSRNQLFSKHYSSGSRSHFHALVHNAAFDYFNRVVPVYSIKKPGSVNITCKYYDYDKNGQYHIPLISHTVFSIPEVRVHRNQADNSGNRRYRGSDGVYALTVHELTHAGIRERDRGLMTSYGSLRYHKDVAIMNESWASGVESKATTDRYVKLNASYITRYRHNLGWGSWDQAEPVEDMNEYTPLVVDLYDIQDNSLLGGPKDKVEGFTLSQIEDAINETRNIETMREKLKKMHNPKATSAQIDELFEYVLQVKRQL